MEGATAETILRGGVFPTVGGATALAMAGGRVLAVGDEQDVRRHGGQETRTIDLGGQAVLPGFIDSHTHLLTTGLTEIAWETNLAGLSRGEALSRLSREAHRRGPGEWVVARGWDESSWKDRRFLTRADLDRVSTANPLVAVRVDGHLLAANAPALKRLPLGLPPASLDLESGLVREEGVTALLRAVRPDVATQRQALRAAARLAHRLGITSVHAMVHPDEIPPFLRERGRMRLRVTLCPDVSCMEALSAFGATSGLGDEWVRLGGVKILADGSIGAQNAALSSPYEGSRHRGRLNYATERLLFLVRRAEASGLQTVIHAIGDRAVEQVLQVHRAAGSGPELRHRIEHFELASDDQIDRARALGLSVSMQPNFAGDWSGEGRMYETRLGKERDLQIDRHRRILDSSLGLAFGSDSMPMSPLYGLHWAVNAPHPSQRVSVEEGIACYTEAGARLSFEETEKGRLVPGARADVVVLSEDPRAGADRLAQLEVVMTFVGGEEVFPAEGEACA